jgi:uncharacterized protein (UPF0332 family)
LKKQKSRPQKMIDDVRKTRVIKAKLNDIRSWKEGIALEKTCGVELSEFLIQLSEARLVLAREQKDDGDKLLKSKPPKFRSAISRYYYAMYNSLRASVFLDHQGDDFQEHSKLPSNLPSTLDLVETNDWGAILGNARDLRNKADYEPFVSNTDWRLEAKKLKINCENAIKLSTSFVAKKRKIL